MPFFSFKILSHCELNVIRDGLEDLVFDQDEFGNEASKESVMEKIYNDLNNESAFIVICNRIINKKHITDIYWE